MSSKRAAAKEWKRKRNQQKLMFRLSVIGVCILALLGIGYIAWDMYSRTYVMTFEGQRIPTAELNYFNMLSGRQNAADHLAYFLVVNQRAQQHNITFTSEEWDGIVEGAGQTRAMAEMFETPLDGISDDRLNEFVSMSVLVTRLTELYTADYEIDETEFANALGAHLFFERAEFVEMDFRFHVSPHMDDAEAIRAELYAADPADIDTILLRELQQFAMDFEEEPEVDRITMEDMRMMGLDQFILMELANLQPGDISEPFQMDETTVIVFIVDSLHVPSDAEIEANFRESFIWEQRTEMFADLLEVWREEADIRMNYRGINAA
ncbi:MAG: hypothetical protein FWC91_09205 [Defluviitaleaceae bacterium]|nr:hypothetical protein [Defluviitaleaceae bacterium]